MWLFVCLHGGNSSDVTLAIKDAQVIHHLSGEETENTDDAYDTADTDDTDDTDDIESIENILLTVE